MKRSFLSTLILFMAFACNQTSVAPQPPGLPQPALPVAARDSIKSIKPGISLGIGLTLEEIKDDTLFDDGSIPTSWEVAGITDVKGFKLFLKKIQSCVFDNHKEQLANYIRYPLGRSIRNESDFVKNYDRLFTKDVKLSIAKLNFSQVFRNSKGAMSEGGRVWFSQVGDDFKIIAVNN